MMHKIPIVASDGFCVNEMFIHNKNALVANVSDRKNFIFFISNLKMSIDLLVNDQNLAGRLATTAREIYKEKYNIRNVINSYKEI